MSRLCFTCKDTIGDLTNDLFSEDEEIIPDFYKKIGNYSLLPPPINSNPKFNLYGKTHIEECFPLNYDSTRKVNIKSILPKINDTWVFFWAARPRNYHKTSYQEAESAYGSFSNCGLSKIDKNGDVTFKFFNPYPYQQEGTKYPPHLHFVYLDKRGFWNDRFNTLLITPDVVLDDFKYMLMSEKYIVINALPKENPYPKIDNTIHIPFDTHQNTIMDILKKHVPNLLLNKHNDIKHIPYVVFCKNQDCDASDMLIKNLRKLGFINIITFKAGIEKYLEKKK